MYYTGATDARERPVADAVHDAPAQRRRTPSRRHEPAFRDIQQYLLSLEPPKYPVRHRQGEGGEGRGGLQAELRKCHGTYGENWTYPNKIIPLDEIGTDPKRHAGLEMAYGVDILEVVVRPGEDAAGSWTASNCAWTPGYQAPPLDGIWATAPYLHNGSVPTLYNVLNSKSRPKLYTRSFKTDEADYDKERVGWKVTELREPPSDEAAARSSGGRCTTRPNPAAATPATPTATT